MTSTKWQYIAASSNPNSTISSVIMNTL